MEAAKQPRSLLDARCLPAPGRLSLRCPTPLSLRRPRAPPEGAPALLGRRVPGSATASRVSRRLGIISRPRGKKPACSAARLRHWSSPSRSRPAAGDAAAETRRVARLRRFLPASVQAAVSLPSRTRRPRPLRASRHPRRDSGRGWDRRRPSRSRRAARVDRSIPRRPRRGPTPAAAAPRAPRARVRPGRRWRNESTSLLVLPVSDACGSGAFVRLARSGSARASAPTRGTAARRSPSSAAAPATPPRFFAIERTALIAPAHRARPAGEAAGLAPGATSATAKRSAPPATPPEGAAALVFVPGGSPLGRAPHARDGVAIGLSPPIARASRAGARCSRAAARRRFARSRRAAAAPAPPPPRGSAPTPPSSCAGTETPPRSASGSSRSSRRSTGPGSPPTASTSGATCSTCSPRAPRWRCRSRRTPR
jgi:hypothetical protein